MKIAKEGYPFVFTSAVLVVVAGVASLGGLALFFLILFFLFFWFFRDPDRYPPTGEELIISPADGRIVEIKQVSNGRLLEGGGIQVSIFLSPLDVHVNRAPVKGKVEKLQYQRGKFSAAYHARSSDENEQNSIAISDSKGRLLSVVQIAGALARRIVCHVKEGEMLEQGQRFGIIMFGSRVDLFLPQNSKLEVKIEQRVRGGETIIGRFS